MSEPRIVSPQEAQADIDGCWISTSTVQRLAHTVATEPDRTRAAQAEAWTRAVEWFAAQHGSERVKDVVLLAAEDANPYCAVESGADW